MAKKIPYGLTDFVRVRKDNYYYVDKSQYIELLEQMPSFLFLIRPRRFGKTLFLNMLYCYYDVRYTDQFNELFGNLYIGQHPTSERNSYLILKFNFSAISGTGAALEKSFNEYVKMQIESFAFQYKDYFEPDFLEQLRLLDTAASQLNYVASCARDLKRSIYLLIDEYDNFTNTILSTEGNEIYRSLTHASGFFRGFF